MGLIGLLMASYGGFYGILTGLTSSADHPSMALAKYSLFVDLDPHGWSRSCFWVAVKEIQLSYHNSDLFCDIIAVLGI